MSEDSMGLITKSKELMVKSVPLEDPRQKGLRPLMLRVGKHRLGWAGLDDYTLVHEHEAISHLTRETHFVRYYYHCHAVFRQRSHDVEHVPHQFGVER